ncbi:ParD-like family protein [Kiloniella laminariae]|uniref:ParD-like family protein n=1 Tax=Kiloniella laminariae TaxID=454162 RepID=A0ABT4LNZ9_9PROT|nr:ParD-like family protein [Kiloniella laminariae]MCZ4282865.1 ParD-like family protein [Kiloniella laminariae]
MGIVKISSEAHEQLRLASKAMTRSINAQAEHWMKVGRLCETHPQLTYPEILALLMEEARALEGPENQNASPTPHIHNSQLSS